jgi:hypothetical protein
MPLKSEPTNGIVDVASHVGEERRGEERRGSERLLIESTIGWWHSIALFCFALYSVVQ